MWTVYQTEVLFRDYETAEIRLPEVIGNSGEFPENEHNLWPENGTEKLCPTSFFTGKRNKIFRYR